MGPNEYNPKSTSVSHLRAVANTQANIMKKKDIENIDIIVQSWKYKMCVNCAILCEGNSLYDLYLSSNNCKSQKHAVQKRTPLLKGYGKLCAAVEYINATLNNKVNDLFEAEYHAKNAIKCSVRYKDNLNACIRKLATKLLRDINDFKKKKTISPVHA